jgi:hypothetical protein
MQELVSKYRGRGLAIIPLVAAFFFACGPQRLEADILVNDGMSNQANYSFGFFNSNPGNPDDISNASFFSLSPGGNPDAFFTVVHDHDVTRDGNGEPPSGNGVVELLSLFEYLPTTYNPSLSGALQSVSFSLDIRYETNQADFSRIFFIVADQNGAHLGGFTDIATDSGWQTITASGLTASDFPTIDFNGSLPLSFGFGFYSNVNVFGGPTSSSIDADNFVVSVNTVPEPSTCLLALPMLLFAALRRYRHAC